MKAVEKRNSESVHDSPKINFRLNDMFSPFSKKIVSYLALGETIEAIFYLTETDEAKAVGFELCNPRYDPLTGTPLGMVHMKKENIAAVGR